MKRISFFSLFGLFVLCLFLASCYRRKCDGCASFVNSNNKRNSSQHFSKQNSHFEKRKKMQYIEMPVEDKSLKERNDDNTETNETNNFVLDNDKVINNAISQQPVLHIGLSNFNDIKQGDIILLDKVTFINSSSILSDSSIIQLNDLMSWLKTKPNAIIEIQGFCSLFDPFSRNQDMSEKYALSVNNYFIKQGVEQKQMIYEGYGNRKEIKFEQNYLINPVISKSRIEIFVKRL